MAASLAHARGLLPLGDAHADARALAGMRFERPMATDGLGALAHVLQPEACGLAALRTVHAAPVVLDGELPVRGLFLQQNVHMRRMSVPHGVAHRLLRNAQEGMLMLRRQAGRNRATVEFRSDTA